MGVACWHGNASCTSVDNMDVVMGVEGSEEAGSGLGGEGQQTREVEPV